MDPEPRLSPLLFHFPCHFLSSVLHPLTLSGSGTQGMGICETAFYYRIFHTILSLDTA